MRLIHTSDWHLGHTLHDLSRRFEHQRFLAWLLDRIEAEKADALVIAGDVFDVANPSSEAQADYYGFLAEARRRFPAVDLVVVGGNHDSASRLDAPHPLLSAFGVRVVGGYSHRDEVDRLLVPLTREDGTIGAWIAAVPFLRPSDLPKVEDGDALIEGVRRLYASVLESARAKRQPGQALIATGHLYMTGGEVSELSERKILGGNQHALPVDIFPEDVAYVALGHLHLAQKVGGRAHVRYSGSPIPLSFSESNYNHQICVVDLEGERLKEVRSVPVPRAVELLRLPEGGGASLDEVVKRLDALPNRQDESPETLPLLEVTVRLAKPEPTLRATLDAALANKAARLARIAVERTGTGQSAADGARKPLRDLSAEEVFRLRYARDHEGEPGEALLSAFHELIDTASQKSEAA